jgi:two-component system OmpR family sensor kinase
VKRISLRWKLIFLSGSLALIGTVAVGAMLEWRSYEQFVAEIVETLDEECDEVITVLQDPDLEPFVDDFLRIETSYRFTPHRYFYQIREVGGRTLTQSRNFQSVTLPLPTLWNYTTHGQAVHVETVPGAISPDDDPLLIRSERVEVNVHGRGRETLIIQIAVSLGVWHTKLRDALVRDSIVTAAILAGMFPLIWFVTTMALRPVAAITRNAAQISAKNLADRIPIEGGADELDELARVLNAMLDGLSESMQLTAEFSADAAHQLRTPLTRIQGKVDVMLRREIADPLRAELETLQQEVLRLSRLCNRLLLLGRLELHTGEAHLMSERVDLKELAEELVEQCSPVAHEDGVTLEIGTAVAAQVPGNRILLVEALLNLIDNAIRWTPRGGVIRVSVGSNGREATLSVADSGPGIPDQERDRIFQPFYRVGGTSAPRASEGFGLGLSIVRAIVRGHKGRAEVAPTAGAGCELRLIIPVCSAD